MGLIIETTENKQINMQGLDGLPTPAASVYARLEIAFRPDGSNTEVAFPYQFLSKDAFKLGAPALRTDLPASWSGKLQEQTMLAAHEAVAEQLTKEGFKVTIDL